MIPDPDQEAVEASLADIFTSDEFASSAKMRELLRYLVGASLDADSDRLKGYSIGVDVFERDASFDPSSDSIVRVQVARLRKMLDYYYLTDGRDAALRLDIPKGAYVVTFHHGKGAAPGAQAATPPEEDEETGDELDAVEAEAAKTVRPPRRIVGAETGPGGKHVAIHLPLPSATTLLGLLGALIVLGAGYMLWQKPGPAPQSSPVSRRGGIAADRIPIAVLPLTNLTGDASKSHITDGFTDHLTTEIARNKLLSVLSRTTAFQYREPADISAVGRKLGVRYILEGSLQQAEDRLRVNVQLIDAERGGHIWAENYDRVITDLFTTEQQIVSTIAAELRPQLYNAAVRELRGQPIEQLEAWQLFLLATWTPGEAMNSYQWEKQRVEYAEKALQKDPNLGPAHSVVAEKLAYLADVDPASDTEELLDDAADHALLAMGISPDDADAVFNVSIYYWHAGGINNSYLYTRRVLELDPNHGLARFLAIVVPFTCAKAPPEVIEKAEQFDAALSPDNPIRWITLNWIARLYFNNGDFALAEEPARRGNQIFKTPDTVFLLAAVLNKLGKQREALSIYRNQLVTWPQLDPRHYANVATPRRCEAQDRADFVRTAYSEFADSVDAAGLFTRSNKGKASGR